MRRQLLAPSLVLLAALSGCSIDAPKYTPSVYNVQALRDASATAAKVGGVSAAGDEAHDGSIGLRGTAMHSPYGSYSAYLRDALTQELREAKLLDDTSQVEISAQLLKNDIHAAGLSSASADIEARFKVARAGQTRYDKISSAHLEWDSSFVGAIAIPRAQQHYPEAVAALLARLYADREFLAALKP